MFTCATCGETFHNRAPYIVHVRTAHQQQQTNNRKRSATTSNNAPAAKKSKRKAQASGSSLSEPPLQVPVGKQIQFLSLQTLFQALRKMLLRRNSNTGHKSVPDLAATTDFKTGTISASLPSTPPASANSWDRSSPISLPSSKSTSLLILLSVIQKPEPYSIITPLWTIIWCWTSHSWSPIKMI